jgi:hypothetical protein
LLAGFGNDGIGSTGLFAAFAAPCPAPAPTAAPARSIIRRCSSSSSARTYKPGRLAHLDLVRDHSALFIHRAKIARWIDVLSTSRGIHPGTSCNCFRVNGIPVIGSIDRHPGRVGHGHVHVPVLRRHVEQHLRARLDLLDDLVRPARSYSKSAPIASVVPSWIAAIPSSGPIHCNCA